MIRIVEVGPRDGLQNEPTIVPTSDKLTLIQQLVEAGCREIEVAAFVHPKLVPQMADASEICEALRDNTSARFSALVPNEKGLERALAAGVTAISVFTAASESFCQKNIGRSIQSSLEEYAAVVATAKAHGCWVRGYVSTVTHCPYEGMIRPQQVLPVAEALLTLGCDEVALGETLGRATPEDIAALLRALTAAISPTVLAAHLHDTYGRALEGVAVALDLGLTTFDGAVSGLGGCPFAPGAAGNLATESLVGFLHARGYETGIDLKALIATGSWLRTRALGRQ